MKIKLNGEDKIFEKNSLTIDELLKVENVKDPNMVSVQLNGELINKETFSEVEVKESDGVDFLYFMGGGN